MKIIIPALNDKTTAVFEVQTLLIPNGEGECIITGLVDTVIIESVQVALSYLKWNSSFYNISKNTFKNSDIHIHFTDGSFAKEGSSAGLGILLSIVSSITNSINITTSTLCTGEIDLYGNIIEVGGINKKIDFFKKNKPQHDYFLIPTDNSPKEKFKDILPFKNFKELYICLKSIEMVNEK